MADRFVDTLITLRVLSILTTPFNLQPAYFAGIIDEKGNQLKKSSTISASDKDSFTPLHRLVFRVKQILEKVPVENKKLLSWAAAYALIREQSELLVDEDEALAKYFAEAQEDTLAEEIALVESYLDGKLMLPFKLFREEVVANNAAATPGVAGLETDPAPVKLFKQTLRRTKKKKNENGSGN